MLKVTAPNKAGMNPCTQNPSKERRPKRKETKISIKALITKPNSPKLIKFRGRVKILRIGRMKVLTRANKITAKKAEDIPLSSILSG